MQAVPQEWLEGVPGEWIVGMHMHRLGRTGRQLLEVETYRMMLVLCLPTARGVPTALRQLFVLKPDLLVVLSIPLIAGRL